MEIIKIVLFTIFLYTETLEGCLNLNIPPFSSISSPRISRVFDSEEHIISSGLSLTCHGQVVNWQAYMERRNYRYDLVIFQIWRPQTNDNCMLTLVDSHRIDDYQVGSDYLLDTSTLSEPLVPTRVEPGDVIGVYVAAREDNPSRTEGRIGVQQYRDDNTDAWINQVPPGSIGAVSVFDSCGAGITTTQGAPVVNPLTIEDVITTSPPVITTEFPTINPEFPTITPEFPTITPEFPTITPEFPTITPEFPTTAGPLNPTTDVIITTDSLITTAQTEGTPAISTTGASTDAVTSDTQQHTTAITGVLGHTSDTQHTTEDILNMATTDHDALGNTSSGISLSVIIIAITAVLLLAILIMLCILVLLCCFRTRKTKTGRGLREHNTRSLRKLPEIPTSGATIKLSDMHNSAPMAARNHLEASNIYESPGDIRQMQSTSIDEVNFKETGNPKLAEKALGAGEDYEVPISTLKRHNNVSRNLMDPPRSQLEASNVYETPNDAANRAASIRNPCLNEDGNIYETPDAFAPVQENNINDEDYTEMTSIWPPTL